MPPVIKSLPQPRDDGLRLDGLTGRPVPLAQFLELAVAIAHALDGLHSGGQVHGDVRPQRIVVDPDNAWAQLLPPRDDQSGALAYRAPESSSRTSSRLDRRSDLYSLGVTLYELLTGRLPFEAPDALEWAHFHLARMPRAPMALVPSVPPVISEIVMKLLAKDPEDRYQSALGLRLDLDRCGEELQARSRIEPFTVGTHDGSGRLAPSHRLYGRGLEVQSLQRCFDRVLRGGQTEVVAVVGPAGIGKSALLASLAAPALERRACFGSGKFEQLRANVPYSGLAGALTDVAGQLATAGSDEVLAWRNVLGEVLGNQAGPVVEAVPALERLIRRSPQAPLGEPDGGFMAALARLIGALGRPGQPLVLALDDLQWADPASLLLLTRLLSGGLIRNLLLAVALRDEESGPSEASCRELRARALVLEPAPLAEPEVALLLADRLGRGPGQIEELAQYVHVQTGGNPLLISQMLGELQSERVITLDARRRQWAWDGRRLRKPESSASLIDLSSARLQRLPPEPARVVTLMAAVGGPVDLSLMAGIAERSADELEELLRPALKAGILVKRNSSVTFAHDEVRRAAYRRVAESERRETHRRIARVMIARHRIGHRGADVFTLVDQIGASLPPADSEEAVHWAGLHLLAGRRALAAGAHDSAAAYLDRGLGLVDGRGLSLRARLELARAEVALAQSDHELAAALVTRLLDHAVDVGQRASACRVAVRLHVAREEPVRAVELAVALAPELGLELQARPGSSAAASAYGRVRHALGERTVASLVDLQRMPPGDARAALELLAALLPAALATDEHLAMVVACGMVELSIEHGNTPESAIGYVQLGMLLGSRLGRMDEGYQFGCLAHELVQRHQLHAERAGVELIFGRSIVPWTRHAADGVHHLRSAFESAVEAGEMSLACSASESMVASMLAAGQPLEAVVSEAEKCLVFAGRHGRAGAAVGIQSVLRVAESMRGSTVEIGRHLGGDGAGPASFDGRLDAEQGWENQFQHQVRALQAAVFEASTPKALEAGAKAEALARADPSPIAVVEHAEYWALALAQAVTGAEPEAAAPLLERLQALRRRLNGWAEQGGQWIACRAALVEAEAARVRGQEAQALSDFDRAVRLARKAGLLDQEALAQELSAGLHELAGRPALAAMHLGEAVDCYRRWGAQGKVAQLERRRHLLHEPAPHAAALADDGLDALALIQASQAISGIIVLEELLENLIRTVIAHAGADRCSLVLRDRGRLAVRAEATMNSEGVHVRVYPASEAPGIRILPWSVVEWVSQRRQPVLLRDAPEDETFRADPYIARQRPRSLLCLPLLRHGDLAGLIHLENSLVAGAFGAGDLRVLEMLGAQAAISLENARLYGTLRQENTERKRAQAALRESEAMARAAAAEEAALRRVATAVANGDQPHELFALAAQEVAQLFGVESGTVIRFRGDGKTAVLGSWSRPGADRIVRRGGFPTCAGTLQDFVLEGRGGNRRRLREEETQYRWAIAAPVRVSVDLWGALCAASTAADDPFPAGAEERLTHFSDLVGLAIGNADSWARMAAQVAADPLTGLLNHRAFHERLDSEVERARRHGHGLALVILDVDRFKLLNDGHGHQAGDEMLKVVAATLTQSSRTEDILGRIGGDEFTVLLPEMDSDSAQTVAERLRRLVEERTQEPVGKVTISAGVCDLRRAGSAKELVRLADAALYEAKAGGRNVVVCAVDPQPPEESWL